MPNSEETSRPREVIAPSTQQAAEVNPLVGETAGIVEGKVSEIAPELSTQATGKSASQSKQAQKKKEEAQLTERDLIKAQLLKNAPKTKIMREETRKILEKKRDDLEVQIKNFRKKKQYHLLSAAIMKLRLVMRQIESVARAGAEQLKEIWLKVVHKFA